MDALHKFSSYHDLLAIPGSLIAGIITYAVMSIFFVPFRITVPEAIVVSILVFGLTKYYAGPNDRQLQVKNSEVNALDQPSDNNNHYAIDDRNKIPISNLLFVGIYLTLLIIASISPHSNLEIFLPWKEISIISFIQLGTAMALCFFFPGYAVISVVDKAHNLRPLLRGLLAYILSMFFSGFTGYVLASLGFPLLDLRLILIVIYALALLPFAAFLFWRISSIRKKIMYTFVPQKINMSVFRFFRNTKKRISVLLIFGSLITLIILSTYSLYGGIIIGDQWFHHGRSLAFIYGGYSNLAASGLEYIYPPFLSALLAVFSILSGNTPSVNAYASISFLNIVPVLAFYYFFTSWISGPRVRKVGILASALFLLSAGFGWFYALDIALNHPLTSPLTSLQTLYTASKETFDIRSPSTFILASHPDFSTSIQLIVLPIGFVLLGLIKEVAKSRQIKFYAIVFTITTLAILSHDEIYLFIIIASILPLAFRLPEKDFLYAGLLCSILFTVLLDSVFPGEYSENKFFGLPLQGLCILFTAIMWLLYSSKILFRGLSFLKSCSLPKEGSSKRLMVILGLTLVTAVAFLYTFTYIVWADLSFKEIQVHISTSSVPWYLYPLKMGMMGVLGLAFVISYVFRKFEKEVFVFGIISLFALLLGPYYDEHRFSKYVMVGMIGFASLLIYELILYMKSYRFNYLFTGILIGSVIVLSSFSTLLFIGYHALALDTDRLDLALGRRDFPSLSEMAMLSFLQQDSRANHATENSTVVTFANEYQRQHGLLGKLEGFSGIPISLLLKEPLPLTLNASTLDGLYSHLASSDSRYILLPKKDIHGDTDEGEKLSNVLKFVYNHFDKAYEDDNFVILYVPPRLALPSSSGDIALLHDPSGFLSSPVVSEKKMDLPFNNASLFKSINNSEYVKFEKNKSSVILYGDKKGNTLWSNRLQLQNKTQTINYIEGKLRFIGENKTKIHNDCGVTWEIGKKKYYTYLRDDKLGFRETPGPENQFVPENKELKWQEWIWYTLKIIFEKDGAKVYVDDSLKLQIPGNFIQDNRISRVGVRCSGGIAEFEPIRVGANPSTSNNSFQERYDTFHHFYPLSALALTNLPYDTFIDSDSSAYSKKNVILTDDSSNQEDVNKYLEVVRRGGTLIVMNTNNATHEGGFSKLLSLRQGNSTQFDSIAIANNESKSKSDRVQVSGFARQIDFKSMPNNVSIISSYLRNNQPIAPFAIEKRYDNGGRIIFVNIAGYFDTLYKSPKKYFTSLSNIAKLININTNKSHYEKGFQDMVSGARYIGNLTASGHTVINSSSFQFLDNSNNTYAEEISISNEDKERNYNGQPVEVVAYKKMPVEKMKLYGQYNAVISSDGVTRMPSPYSASSQFDYVAVSLPTRSNVTFELYNGARVEFQSGNQTRQYSFVDNGTVKLQNIKTDIPEVGSVMVLVKKPEFTVAGNISFEALYRGDDFYLTKDVFGMPRELSDVKLKAAVDQVDNYEVAGRSGKKINYLTYLKSYDIRENRTHELDIKIPGDISDSAKVEGMQVPWKEIITSNISVMTLCTLIIAVLLVWLLLTKVIPKVKRKYVQ